MPAVSLAVEASRRDPGVQVGGVMRADLEDVADVQPQQELHPGVVGHLHVADAPQFLPRLGVGSERLAEVRVALRTRSPPWSACRWSPGRGR